MAEQALITRRGALSTIAGAFLACSIPLPASGVAGIDAFAADLTEIMTLLKRMTPIKRMFFEQQMYAMKDGEPNAIDGDFTYDEWLQGFDPECVEWINAGCPRTKLT